MKYTITAEYQSQLLNRLRQQFDLTITEKQVLTRGRNSVSKSSNNRRNPAAYQDSTALEALLGYLYITNSTRCGEVLGWIHTNMDNINMESTD